MKAVRHYTIKMMSGFAKFKCSLCKHSVTTMEFNGEHCRCRTQAARAMNEHAKVAHGCPPPTSLYDSQMWSTRQPCISPMLEYDRIGSPEPCSREQP
jgi:hypothetical protein